MDGRGDRRNNFPLPRFLQIFGPAGDGVPSMNIQNVIFAWIVFLENLGIVNPGFGVEIHIVNHHNNIGNNNVEDNANNNENIDNNNVVNVDNDVGFEDAGVEDNQDVSEENPLPGGSRKRSREDRESEESEQFRWWDEFADSDSDCYDSDADSTGDDHVASTGMNPVQDVGVGANMEVNQHAREVDPLPGGSKKRSRENDEEEDEQGCKKSRRLDEVTSSDFDRISVHPHHDHTDNSRSDDQVEKEDPRPGGSRKRSREEDEEEDGRAGKKFRHNPLPSGSRKRSKEEDGEDEERSRKQFWWLDDSDSDCYDSDADSTGDDHVASTGMNPVQDVGVGDNMEVNQHAREVDPLPGGSKKRSRENDEEDGRAGKQFRR
ncbi:hypothetical protein PAMP_007774 [Pampus punctatissimus]